MKYNNVSTVFAEIPNRVSLCFSITRCQNRCDGCHSPELRGDVGEELTERVIDSLSDKIRRCNCVLFLGEGDSKEELIRLASYVKVKFGKEVALYSGRDSVEEDLFEIFDFIKVGSYRKELGSLKEKTTNQRLFYHGEDITELFWETV